MYRRPTKPLNVCIVVEIGLWFCPGHGMSSSHSHSWLFTVFRTTLGGPRTVAKCKRTLQVRHPASRCVLIWHNNARSCGARRTVLHALAVGRRNYIKNKETTAADTTVCVKGSRTARSNKYHETMLGRTTGNATRFQFVCDTASREALTSPPLGIPAMAMT